MKQYNRRIGKLMALGCLAIGLLWSKMITVSATTIVDENQITIVEDDALVDASSISLGTMGMQGGDGAGGKGSRNGNMFGGGPMGQERGRLFEEEKKK